MILRGQIPKDQLLFELEIEKTARRNKETKRKEKQGDTREESSITSSFPINIFQEESNMAEEQAPPPRKKLGDYAMQQGSKHFSNIAIPSTTKALEMKHVLVLSMAINLPQWTMRIHIHICLHL